MSADSLMFHGEVVMDCNYKRPIIRRTVFTLRLVGGAITVVCVVLATLSYRVQSQRYASKVARQNLETQLLAVETRIESIERRKSQGGAGSWEADALPGFEAEAALYRLMILDFVVTREGYRADRITILAPARAMTDLDLDRLLRALRWLQASRTHTIDQVDVTRSDDHDAQFFVNGMREHFPNLRIVTGSP